MSFWKGRKVCVLGCASFIGSHLCEALLREGADLSGIDDFSSGKAENMKELWDHIDFYEGNLFYRHTRQQMKGSEVLFHLAAEHGGRGYVDKQQCLCSTNLALDNLVFMDAVDLGIQKICFASSGCVYPNFLQEDPDRKIYLGESLVPNVFIGGKYDADKLYGWAKLMGEFTLQAIHKEHGISTTCTRYFTAYGPRAKEDHAVMAMIGRAYIKQDPFEIWGDGTQLRNWTYIDDIVSGTLLAAEHIDDGSGVNIGTMERTSVYDAAYKITELMGLCATFKFLLDKPTGPMNRIASNNLAQILFGWSPAYTFEQGIQKTIEWYRDTKTVEEVKKIFAEEALIDGRKR